MVEAGPLPQSGEGTSTERPTNKEERAMRNEETTLNWEDLTDGQKQWVGNGDVEVIDVGDTWRDDHIICVAVRLRLPNGEQVDIELWWIGEDGYAAAKYASESPQAMEDLKPILAGFVEGQREDEEKEL